MLQLFTGHFECLEVKEQNILLGKINLRLEEHCITILKFRKH